MLFNRILGMIIGVFFAAVMSGSVDFLQGFNKAAAVARELPYNRYVASHVFVYGIPLLGVIFLVFPEAIAEKLSLTKKVAFGPTIEPAMWQFFGYILVVLALLVLWVFESIQ